jgi:NAD+ diphosphatase
MLPGGGVKKDESLQEAVIRELQEEVRVRVTQAVELGAMVFTDQFKHDTVWFFEATVFDLNIKADGVEISEARWFEINKLPKTLSKSALQGLQFYRIKHLSKASS